MTDFARDLILSDPFSMSEFKTTPVGIAATRAIEKHTAEMMSAINAGDPPICSNLGTEQSGDREQSGDSIPICASRR